MAKKIFSFALTTLALSILFATLSSAYYYSYPDNYDRYSYHTERTSGWGPYGSTKTTDYNKETSRYWNGNAWVEQTRYIKTTTNSPYSSYPYSRSYYNPYYYRPWYQKYWGPQSYYRSYPRNYYYYSYYPSYNW